jgi:chromosome segregation ATPase
MKLVLIILLVMAAIILGFRVYSLQKELLSTNVSLVSYEKRSDDLEMKLMRLTKECNEKEQFLEEIEQSITELDGKVQLETLERYIPKKTWDEIKPIIDRLKAFQETR